MKEYNLAINPVFFFFLSSSQQISRGFIIYRRLRVLIARNTINNLNLHALFSLFVLFRGSLSASYHIGKQI